ncbi:MAG: hypothetical protein R6U50_12390 [Desulfobacterales bacterium]
MKVAYWNVREELSINNRVRRSYYELLRDDLEQQMIQHALIDSYNNFKSKKITYPFVEKRELKPRGRIPDLEYNAQNAFLVIFVEENIPNEFKKYIRFLDENKTTKTNLLNSKGLPLGEKFDRSQKYLDSAHFEDFLKALLPVDYALLIQKDPALKSNRYGLTHFHVRIDWPISDAAEDLAQRLRYISKDLYEKGEKYAEDLQKKFFEYYSLPTMIGGRRTAAIVAAQILRRIPCITTVYAGSCESRALIRISERGVSKMVLMLFSNQEAIQIAEENNISSGSFRKHYVVGRKGRNSVILFRTTYAHTTPARPPDDGKIRDLKPDLSWTTVSGQHIIPIPGVLKYPPLPTNVIYTKSDSE